MSPATEGTCTVSQNVPSGLIVSCLVVCDPQVDSGNQMYHFFKVTTYTGPFKSRIANGKPTSHDSWLRPCLIRPKTWSGSEPTKVKCNYICHNLSGFTARILKSGSWNHGVIILSKWYCYCFLNFLFWNCGLWFAKHIAWSFQWYLPIVVRHLESNESSSEASLMVSRIRIQFHKIWPEQTQWILKPVSVLVKSNRTWESRFWLADLTVALDIDAIFRANQPATSLGYEIRIVPLVF